MLAPSLSASATVAAGPLHAASQSRSLVIASNPASQLLRPNSAVSNVSERSPTLLSRVRHTNRQTKSQRLGHTVEP